MRISKIVHIIISTSEIENKLLTLSTEGRKNTIQHSHPKQGSVIKLSTHEIL